MIETKKLSRKEALKGLDLKYLLKKNLIKDLKDVFE